MTPSDREAQYIKETGDEKPCFKDYEENAELPLFQELYDEWKDRFILWLSKRLEKAEEELKKQLYQKNKADGFLERARELIATGVFVKQKDIDTLINDIADWRNSQ